MAKLQGMEKVGAASVSTPTAGNACIWYDSTNRQLKVTYINSGGTTVTCTLAPK